MARNDVGQAPSASVNGTPGRGARIALWIVFAAVTLHSAAIALWVSPPNILKDRVGYDRLRSYVQPMFDQAWSVFAPEADNGYDLFEIRGTLRDGSSEEQTPWVKVTEREVGPEIRYHPFPSRATVITDRLAADQLSRFNELSDDQQHVLDGAEIDVSVEEQGERLLAAASTDAEREAARAYTRTETAIERYLSGIAYGLWGERAVGIEYRQYQVFVPKYQQRDGERQKTTGYLFASKVRPVQDLTDAEKRSFRAYADSRGIR